MHICCCVFSSIAVLVDYDAILNEHMYSSL